MHDLHYSKIQQYYNDNTTKLLVWLKNYHKQQALIASLKTRLSILLIPVYSSITAVILKFTSYLTTNLNPNSTELLQNIYEIIGF